MRMKALQELDEESKGKGGCKNVGKLPSNSGRATINESEGTENTYQQNIKRVYRNGKELNCLC